MSIVVEVPHEGIVGNAAMKLAAYEDDNLMELVAEEPELRQYLECACGGNMACSTCHVIVLPEFYALMPEPEDAENDMLDLAYGLTETSRLGCQIKLRPEWDGMQVTVPDGVNNMW